MTVLQVIKLTEKTTYTDMAAIMGLSVSHLCKIAKGRRSITPWVVWCICAFYPKYSKAAILNYNLTHNKSLTEKLSKVLKPNYKGGVYVSLCN